MSAPPYVPRGERPICGKAPPGWRCKRTSGHDGPCAAEPHGLRGWLRVLFLFGECVHCGKRACPKTGPWYARRRESVYCAGCAWKSPGCPDCGANTFMPHAADCAQLKVGRSP